MPKTYYRFHLTDTGEFLLLKNPQNSLSFLYLLVSCLPGLSDKAAENLSLPLEGSDRKKR